RGGGAFERQPDFEPGFTGAGLKLNLSPMTIGDDAVADDQTQARAGTDSFGGEEWFKDAGLNLRGDAADVLDDFDDELVVFDKGPDANFAGTIDCIDGVIHQVGPDLVQFAGVGEDARSGPVKSADQFDILELVPEHGQGALNALMDVNLLHGR